MGSAAAVRYFKRYRTGVEAFRAAYDWLDESFFAHHIKMRGHKAQLKQTLLDLKRAVEQASPLIIDARTCLSIDTACSING